MTPAWKQLFRRLTYQLFAPGTMLREKYNDFKSLLRFDEASLDLLAEIEILTQGGEVADHSRAVWLCRRLSRSVSALAEKLLGISGIKYMDLPEYLKKIDFYIQLGLALPEADLSPPFMRDLAQAADYPAACGGKAANLSRLARQTGARVLPGCVLTASAFNYFLECNSLRPKLDRLLRRILLSRPAELDAISGQLCELLLSASLPDDIAAELARAADRLGPGPYAVRSSALGEDSHVSFAGQYLSCLSVATEELEDAYKRVLASKYSPAALTYRLLSGLSDDETPMAVLLMPMLAPSQSGLTLSDEPCPENPGQSCLRVIAIQGQGEPLVSGELNGESHFYLPADPPQALGEPASLGRTGEELAGLTMRARQCFGEPLEIEWALAADGLYYLQARPYLPQMPPAALPAEDPGETLMSGLTCVSTGRATGLVRHLRGAQDEVAEDSLIVVQRLYPWLSRYLGRARAVIAARGGVAGHFASVAREFGLPVVIGGDEVFSRLSPGTSLCLDAGAGKLFSGPPDCGQEQTDRPRFLDTPFGQRLSALSAQVGHLNLSDPESEDFRPSNCRSLHDVIRFCHEKGMQEMFNLLGNSGRGMSKAKRLRSEMRLNMYILDLGGGFFPQACERDWVTPDDFRSQPLWSFWWGLADPEQERPESPLMDLSQHEVLSAGLLIGQSKLFASFAVVSADYAHLMLRFGYHFCVVDCVCGASSQANYINFRFKGGGGVFAQRLLRLEFIRRVLGNFGFEVNLKGDLMNARLSGGRVEGIQRRLAVLGKLLIQTPFLDMKLKTLEDVEEMTARFLGAAYH